MTHGPDHGTSRFVLDSKNLPKRRKNNLPSLISHRTLNMSMIVYLFGHRNPKTRKPNTIFLIKVGRTHVFTEYKSTQLTHTKIYIGIDIVAYITFVWGLYWFGILTKGGPDHSNNCPWIPGNPNQKSPRMVIGRKSIPLCSCLKAKR